MKPSRLFTFEPYKYAHYFKNPILFNKTIAEMNELPYEDILNLSPKIFLTKSDKNLNAHLNSIGVIREFNYYLNQIKIKPIRNIFKFFADYFLLVGTYDLQDLLIVNNLQYNTKEVEGSFYIDEFEIEGVLNNFGNVNPLAFVNNIIVLEANANLNNLIHSNQVNKNMAKFKFYYKFPSDSTINEFNVGISGLGYFKSLFTFTII